MLDSKTQAKVDHLQRLVDHPNTPHHEAEAARGRIKALREKYDKQTPPPPKRPVYSTNILNDLMDEMDRAAKAKRTGTNGRCKKPESFFNGGGHPRLRNQYPIDCDTCGVRLAPGEGTIIQVAGYTVGRCCEMKPGPRAKRF
jgi:hypothetical protein